MSPSGKIPQWLNKWKGLINITLNILNPAVSFLVSHFVQSCKCHCWIVRWHFIKNVSVWFDECCALMRLMRTEQTGNQSGSVTAFSRVFTCIFEEEQKGRHTLPCFCRRSSLIPLKSARGLNDTTSILKTHLFQTCLPKMTITNRPLICQVGTPRCVCRLLCVWLPPCSYRWWLLIIN